MTLREPGDPLNSLEDLVSFTAYFVFFLEAAELSKVFALSDLKFHILPSLLVNTVIRSAYALPWSVVSVRATFWLSSCSISEKITVTGASCEKGPLT